MRAFAVVLLLFVFAFFGAFLGYNAASSHDPHWWKHVGIEEVKPHHVVSHGVVDPDAKVQRMRASTNSNMFGVPNSKSEKVVRQDRSSAHAESDASSPNGVPKLVEGKHYHADYDVSKVVNLPYSYPPNAAFRYIPDDSPWPHTWVSMKPRIAVFLNFLTNAECDQLVALAAPKLSRSLVNAYGGGSGKDNVRTSDQTWLDINSGPQKKVVDRILAVTGWERVHAEALQILRYRAGQKYNTHMDYFDPKLYGKQQSNRAVTCFFYLADVPEGGETVFPMADGAPPVYNYTNFEAGLRVKPQKGMLVVFYDMLPDRTLDKWALHGGAPPRNGGLKWAGTLWLRASTPS